MVSTLDDQVVWVRDQPWTTSLNRASGRSRKKSQISRDFQGQIRRKNGPFRGNFAGIFKASFAEKLLVKNGRFRKNFPSKFRWKAIGFALIWGKFSMQLGVLIAFTQASYCSMKSYFMYQSNRSLNTPPENFQGSRLTFQLASPVASERFDLLAKTNFSLARHRHLLRNVNKKFSQTDRYKVFSPLTLTEPPSKLRN